jgi:hypothetical protein
MTDIATVSRPPTPIQAAARATADVLLAGKAPLTPPGKYTVRWTRMATLREVKPGKDWVKAEETIERLLVTTSGQKLVDDLLPLLKRGGTPAATIKVRFMDHKDFPEQNHDDAAGYYFPEEAGEPSYDVFIQWEKNLGPLEFIKPPFQNLRAGKSRMAHTLFHELAHVWFIHAFPGEGTGHIGDKMHPEFSKRLDAALKDLERLDKR